MYDNVTTTNRHNWDGVYPVYNPAAIIGSLHPIMTIPDRPIIQRPHRNHFWHVLVEAIVGAAIMAFAPELSVLFAHFMPGILGQALGFAIAGAASNLAQQEIAIGFGEQQHIAWSAVGQSALMSVGTLGISKAVGLDLMKTTPNTMKLIESATKRHRVYVDPVFGQH